MEEIGGYIEFEHYSGSLFHDKAIPLNCGRHCLTYLIKTRNIEKIWLPYYLCDSVREVCHKENVEVSYFHIGADFKPLLDGVGTADFVYVVNYYGQLENKYIENLHKTFSNLIVDNAQAYFQMPVAGVDTIYTCRKYFGVADGAFLYTNCRDEAFEESLEWDESYGRMHFLLGRFERKASEFYREYVENNNQFSSEPIKRMSRLTENILRSMNYEDVRRRRSDNFAKLHKHFETINRLNIMQCVGAFMYPLYLKNGEEIRQQLRTQNVYIPTLWQGVMAQRDADFLERGYAVDILPLPCDQRYGDMEMSMIEESIENCYKTRRTFE